MNIKDQVFTGLDASDVPSWFGAYKETEEYPTPPPCYIVFTTMSVPSKYTDDVISEWKHYAYLEMWATGSYAAQKTNVIASMQTAGFVVDPIRDGYEPDTGNNHISMAFVYIEEVA